MKFLGLYRLQPHAPSFMVPLFTDGSFTYVQKINSSQSLDAYTRIETADSGRLVIKNEMKVITPGIGSPAIYAFEYKQGSFTLGSHHEIHGRLKSLLETNEFIKQSKFSSLEIARFIGDDELIYKFAKKCFDQLSQNSKRLSEKWLCGAELSPSVRNRILLENSDLKKGLSRSHRY